MTQTDAQLARRELDRRYVLTLRRLERDVRRLEFALMFTLALIAARIVGVV